MSTERDQTPEPESNPEKETFIRVSKVHFLIHPGFASDPNFYVDDPKKYIVKKQHLDDYGLMSKRYLAKAEKIRSRPNEIMIAFLHQPGKQFRKEYKKPNNYRRAALYTQIISDLKTILGKRLIVLSSDFDILKDPDKDSNTSADAKKAWETIVKIARTKHFTIDNTVESEAYGEFLFECVKTGAFNLNRANELKYKTVIRPKITEVGGDSVDDSIADAKKQIKNMRQQGNSELDNIDFKF